SVGSTEASASLFARVGVVGPTRARSRTTTGTVSQVWLGTVRNRPVAVCRSVAHWNLAAGTGYAASGYGSGIPGGDRQAVSWGPGDPTGRSSCVPRGASRIRHQHRLLSQGLFPVSAPTPLHRSSYGRWGRARA